MKFLKQFDGKPRHNSSVIRFKGDCEWLGSKSK